MMTIVERIVRFFFKFSKTLNKHVTFIALNFPDIFMISVSIVEIFAENVRVTHRFDNSKNRVIEFSQNTFRFHLSSFIFLLKSCVVIFNLYD